MGVNNENETNLSETHDSAATKREVINTPPRAQCLQEEGYYGDEVPRLLQMLAQ